MLSREKVPQLPQFIHEVLETDFGDVWPGNDAADFFEYVLHVDELLLKGSRSSAVFDLTRVSQQNHRLFCNINKKAVLAAARKPCDAASVLFDLSSATTFTTTIRLAKRRRPGFTAPNIRYDTPE